VIAAEPLLSTEVSFSQVRVILLKVASTLPSAGSAVTFSAIAAETPVLKRAEISRRCFILLMGFNIDNGVK
jgi:hypothetical protein